jgi:di/tricarboxylate transporter
VRIDKEKIRTQLAEKGSLTRLEKRTIFWLLAAIILWTTDSIHGLDLGWITFIVAMLMSLPLFGEVLDAKAWSDIPVHVLLFLTAAMAIGRVGSVTGANVWIAETLLPSTVPSSIFALAAVITAASMVIHLLLGSVIAVMGVAIPALLAFTAPIGINPLIPSLLVYTAISIHYVLPFHHLNILVGEGQENGMYTQKETLRMAIPLTVIVFVITLLVQMPWWKLLGLY